MKNMIKVSAAIVSALLFTGCNFEQATPPCAVGHGGYAAELVKITGPASGRCVRRADIIGVQKFRQENGDQVITLKPEVISILEYGNQGADFTSLATGTLAENEPNAEGYCTVSELSVATGGVVAGYDLTYRFSNVEFYVQGSTAGTQFRADLEISSPADGAEPACTATYEVRAMYPVVFCNAYSDDVVAHPHGVSDAQDPDKCKRPEDGTQHVDDIWSGVAANPLFDAKCSAYGNPDETPAEYDWFFPTAKLPQPVAWQVCVPAGEIPSLL